MIPTFPDVPDALGVPPVFRLANQAIDTVNALIADEIDVGDPQSLVYGIFDDQGEPVIISDNVPSFEFQAEERIADYPLEQGAFESYNKVELPYVARFELTRGGTDADRTEFLTSLDAAKHSLSLYTVVTPEYTYLNANVVDYSYRRTADRGVSMLTAEIRIEEVRVSAVTTFTSSKSVSGTPPVNDGVVQPKPLATNVGPPD